MYKKFFSVCLALALVFALLPAAALTAGAAASGDFTIDQNGTLTKYNGPGGHVVIPDGVKSVGGFSGCDSLLSVTIPDSVTSIQSSAFRECSSLKEINLPAGVTSIGSAAFQDCKSLESIVIPNGVTRIESNTFVNCLKLAEVILPNSVTYISDQAFEKCTSLARINIPSGVTTIGMWAFYGCSALENISLPDGLTRIMFNAFALSGLREVTIPGSYTVDTSRTGDDGSAFGSCPNLTKVVICEGVTNLAGGMFAGCPKLTTVYLPKSVATIGQKGEIIAGPYHWDIYSSTFVNSGVTDVYYGGTQAQWDQVSILTEDPSVEPLMTKTIHYNSDIPANAYDPTIPTPSTPGTSTTASTAQTKDVNGNTFQFTLDPDSNSWTLTLFTPGSDPKNVVVPDTVEGKPVKAIGSMAFSAQTAIETVQLPDAVTSIGDRAFLNCWGLKTVNIPKSATIIGVRAFDGCAALQSVEFPYSLTTIEANAFWNCTSLTSVSIPDSVVNLGSKTVEPDNWGYTGMVFAGCSSLKDISVGSGAADFYRAFKGTAVETAIVPNTTAQSLNAQSSIFPYKYQTYEMYGDCKNLKTAYVESGVRALMCTFSGCTKLEALYLPKTVTTLYNAVSASANHHVDIYYEGSQEEFDKIDVTSSCLDYITVHYNSYTPVNFSTDYTRTALVAADALHDLGLFNGVGNDASGNPIYSLDRAPTRYEAVTMLVRLLGKEEEAQAGVWSTPFTDVTEWAKPYVGYAYAHGLTDGVSADRFGGTSTATKEQYATFILRALGYTSGTDFQWNAPWELLAKTGVMLEGSAYWLDWAKQGTSAFCREDVVLMSFLSLSAKVKGTDTPLIEKILDGSGTHTHSYQSYTLPATGSYEKVSVERTRQVKLEYHCNLCGYISYDYDDFNYHQMFNFSVCCGSGGHTYPDFKDGIMRPWYSTVREWTQSDPEVTLHICTVCGHTE